MKIITKILLALFMMVSGVYSTLACSCVSDSIDKRFKKASAIFVGKVPDDDPENNNLIQKYSNANKFSQTLEVVKEWKGIKKQFVTVDFDQANLGASCPTLYMFEDDKEYLVFAYGKELKVRMVCSDTSSISSEYNSTSQREIRKLNSFSFRFWSSVNPF